MGIRSLALVVALAVIPTAVLALSSAGTSGSRASAAMLRAAADRATDAGSFSFTSTVT